MMCKETLSIVVPCYNESKTLMSILERFAEAIGDRAIEVILVDNGSTDDSATILTREIPKYFFARHVHVSVNQGYGYGILTGLNAATGDILGWTHADMQTDPKDVIRGADLIRENGRAFVKGTRKNRSLFDVGFTVGMSLFETLLLRIRLWDINAQPNLFPRDFFESWQNPPHDFALDLYVYWKARQNGLPVIRFPCEFPPRPHGMSHWNTGFAAKLKFIKRTVAFSLRLAAGPK